MSIKPSEEILGQFKFCMKISDFMSEGNVKLLPTRFIYLAFMGLAGCIALFHSLHESWPNVSYICSAMIVFLLCLQLFARLAGRLLKNDIKLVEFVMNSTSEFYKREELIEPHKSVLLENLQHSDFAVKIYMICWFVLFNILNPAAWIVSWYTGEFILLVRIYVPYTDPQTLFGYILNSILLWLYNMLVYVMFMLADLVYIFTTLQCIPMADIYCLKLKSFGENLIKFKAEKPVKVKIIPEPQSSTLKVNQENYEAILASTTESKLKMNITIPGTINDQPSLSKRLTIKITDNEPKPKTLKANQLNHTHLEMLITEAEKNEAIKMVEKELINLIKEFTDYNEYVKAICSIMESTTFVAVSTNALGIAMAFVVTFYYSKVVGGLQILFLFIQVLMPCIVGTIIGHQKEKVIDELYEFPWYELSTPKQKIFLQFLHLCQESHEFTVPIVGELDMELFTNVMNGAYSYLMSLIEFAKRA